MRTEYRTAIASPGLTSLGHGAELEKHKARKYINVPTDFIPEHFADFSSHE
jgi:hypothetical protein